MRYKMNKKTLFVRRKKSNLNYSLFSSEAPSFFIVHSKSACSK